MNKRILLEGQEPLDISNAKKRLNSIKQYVEGLADLEGGLSIRKNPLAGDYGRLNLNDVCTEACVRTMMHGFLVSDFPSDFIYILLNPSKIGLPDTPYKEKMPVVQNILNEFYGLFYGGHHSTVSAGNISNPCSPNIKPQVQSTRFFWVRNKESGFFEVVYDTEKEETTCLFKDSIPSFNNYVFKNLRKRHEKENLFLEDKIDFIHGIGKGWFIPIFGINKIVGVFSEENDFYLETILSREGTKIREIEKEELKKYSLFPNSEEYWTRNP